MSIDKDDLYIWPRPLHHWRGNARFRYPRSSEEWAARFDGINRDLADILGHTDASGSVTHQGFMDHTSNALAELEGQVLGIEPNPVSDRSLFFAGPDVLIDSLYHFSVYGLEQSHNSFLWEDGTKVDTARTFSAWVHANSLVSGTTESWNIVGMHSPYSNTNLNYGYGLYMWNGRIVGNASTDSTEWFDNLQYGPISTGVWYHVALTFDGAHTTAVDTGKLYVNGELVAEHTSSGNFYDNYAFTIGCGATWPNWSQGGGGATEATGYYDNYTYASGLVTDRSSVFHGYIDEVSLWRGALSASEVRAIYNHGAPIDLSLAYGDYTRNLDLLAWWRMGESHNKRVVLNSVDTATGVNLLSNKDFSTASDWVLSDASLSISGGNLVSTPSAGQKYARQETLGMTRGYAYRAVVTLSSYTSGYFNVGVSRSPWWTYDLWTGGPGAHEFDMVLPYNYGAFYDQFQIYFSAGADMSVDSITLHQVGTGTYPSHLMSPSSTRHREPAADESSSLRDQYGVGTSSVVGEPFVAGADRADGSGTFQELSRRIGKARFLASDLVGRNGG